MNAFNPSEVDQAVNVNRFHSKTFNSLVEEKINSIVNLDIIFQKV
jgi:hypothetical protein